MVSSETIDEASKLFKWFNCIAYSILAALIARIIVFPYGALQEAELWLRLFVVIICITVYLLNKKNLVYPTVLSAILLALLNNYL